MSVKQFSYRKKEKLKSRKQLERIFTKGKNFTIFPVKVFFMFDEEQNYILKTGVGVSKKNFKKAVERNRIKRLLREAYRREKPILLNCLAKNKKQVALFFLYIDKSLPDFNLIQDKIQQAIKKLKDELNEMAS